jgi:hypothetical protein
MYNLSSRKLILNTVIFSLIMREFFLRAGRLDVEPLKIISDLILWIQLATSSLKRKNKYWSNSSYVFTWSVVSYKIHFLIKDSIYSPGSSRSWWIPHGYTRAIDLLPKMWAQHCHRIWITKGCWMWRYCCTD